MPAPNIPQVSAFTLARASDINAITAALAVWIPTTMLTVTAQTSVVVNHGFGWFPLVQVIDNTGTVVAPSSIQHNSSTQFTVQFGSPFTGTIIYR